MNAPSPPAGIPGTSRLPNSTDRRRLALACELATHCPPSRTAFSAGAVIVAADGTELARGYSRENDPHDHAEEGALAKLPADDPRLATATIYSSLEPCTARSSRPRPCARLVLESGICRVVIAWREPDTFVIGADGTRILADAGVTVIDLPEYADAAKAPNLHVP